MTEFERINAPRVAKIVKLLEMIATSATSNKASEDDLFGIFSPANAAVQMLWPCTIPPDSEAASPGTLDMHKPQHRAQQWADAVQMAKEADLEAAVAAMGVIANRVEQELFEQRGAN